jgi:hypothetical protein
MPPNRRNKPPLTRYSIEDFERYGPAIKRQIDAIFDYFDAQHQYTNELEEKLIATEAELSRLNQKMGHINDMSIVQSVLILVGAGVFAFGVNLATTSPHDWPGWILGSAGFLLQLLAVLIPTFSRLRGNNK